MATTAPQLKLVQGFECVGLLSCYMADDIRSYPPFYQLSEEEWSNKTLQSEPHVHTYMHLNTYGSRTGSDLNAGHHSSV